MLRDKGILKAIWAGMFILCAVMGYLPQTTQANRILLMILAGLFFVPPGLDVWFSYQRKDAGELRLVRNLCMISLGSTLLLLVANMLSVLGNSHALGDGLYWVLVLVSTPMICGRYWAYSLLLWAGLLWCAVAALRHIKK